MKKNEPEGSNRLTGRNLNCNVGTRVCCVARAVMHRLHLKKNKKPKQYFEMRLWWLHELRQLRAKSRISGLNTKALKKYAQRELVRIRKESK